MCTTRYCNNIFTTCQVGLTITKCINRDALGSCEWLFVPRIVQPNKCKIRYHWCSVRQDFQLWDFGTLTMSNKLMENQSSIFPELSRNTCNWKGFLSITASLFTDCTDMIVTGTYYTFIIRRFITVLLPVLVPVP